MLFRSVEHPIFDIWLTACKGGTVVIRESPAEASAPNPDESPPTDPGADAAASPEQTPPPPQAAKKKKPKPAPAVVAAPAPDAEPTTPFDAAPNQSTTGTARAR